RSSDAGSTVGAGARTQTIPSSTDAEAWSGPDRSLPPMGCPGMKRSVEDARALTSWTTWDFTLATSVTTASGAVWSARATVSATLGIGVQTTTSVAPRT